MPRRGRPALENSAQGDRNIIRFLTPAEIKGVAALTHANPGSEAFCAGMWPTWSSRRRYGADDFTSLFRPFRDDFILRAFWEANDFARQSLELRAILDLDVDEQIFEGIYERQLRSVHEELRLIVHLQVIDPASAGDSFFSFFPNSSSLAIRLRFGF